MLTKNGLQILKFHQSAREWQHPGGMDALPDRWITEHIDIKLNSSIHTFIWQQDLALQGANYLIEKK